MRARALLNLVLLVLVIGLVVVVVLEPGSEQAAGPVTLTRLSPAAVTHIRIEPRNHEPLELTKQGGIWRLSTPLAAPANGFRAESLVEVLATPSHGQFPADEHDLAAFGLDEPDFKLRLNDRELWFGNTEPLNNRRYVLADGMVHLITDRFYHHLAANAKSFVNPAPLGPNAQPVTIEVPGLRLQRQDGKWVVSPKGLAVGADTIQALVDAWRNAQATTVSPYDQDLTKEGSIRIRLQDMEAPIRFEVARLEHELIFIRPDLGVQYHLPKNVGERLLSLKAPAAE